MRFPRRRVARNRRRLAEAVAGFYGVEAHYSPDDTAPACGAPLGDRGYLLPLVRLVTCPACHEVIQVLVNEAETARKAHSTVIPVTKEQVRAARIEVNAMRSAGLTPDPIVVRISEVEIP